MVRCDRCGAENPENLTFCRDCGNRLRPAGAPEAAPRAGPSAAQVQSRPPAPDFDFMPRPPSGGDHLTCGRCSSANPPGNRFCVTCGAPLASAQPAAAAAAAPGGMTVSVAQSPIGAPAQAAPPQAAAPHAPVQQAVPQPAPQVVCERCQGGNPAGTRFCQFCGTALRDGSQPHGNSPQGGAPTQAATAVSAPLPAPAPPEIPPAVAQPSPQQAPLAYPHPHAPVQAQGPMGQSARMVVITQDGTPGRDYPLNEAQADIGREEGTIQLPNDPYVSPRHARVSAQNGRYHIRDLGSLNGVYVRLRGPHRLQHGDLVLIGLEVLRFEFVSDAEKNLGPAVERGTQLFGSPATTRHARLCQRTVEGVTRDVYSLTRDETVIGREAGDVVFTSDPFMSRQHAVIARDPQTNEFSIRDLGSSNGTYVAIRGETALDAGDHVRIGQHLFRLELVGGRQH